MKEKSLFQLGHEAYLADHFEEAFALFLEAAMAGDIDAMGRVSLMYYDGEGVKKDIEKSIYWDLKSAKLGSSSAMTNLAITYRDLGNIEEALSWFNKALSSGDIDAAIEIAKIHLHSVGKNSESRRLLKIVVNSEEAIESVKEEAESLLNEYWC